MRPSLEADGFALLPGLLSAGELASIDAAWATGERVGARDLLGEPWCAELARRARDGVVACPVPRGGAMLMRPLLLHASSKATGSSRRRVLHFVFGPARLPLGLGWATVS